MADVQLTLFDDIPAPEVVEAVRFPHDGKPKYRRLTGCAHVFCDDCVLALQQAHWKGPAPLGAAWAQYVDGQVLRLCQAHYAQARLRERRAA